MIQHAVEVVILGLGGLLDLEECRAEGLPPRKHLQERDLGLLLRFDSMAVVGLTTWKRAQHWIANKNQHATNKDLKNGTSHGVCGAAKRRECE